MFKKVLITGITGFVGSHLAEYIVNEHRNTKIYGLVRWRSPKYNISKILGHINFCYGDLEDYSSLEKIFSSVKPDVIFHLAAQSYVDFSFVSPMSTLQANVIGTANLLEAIKTLTLKQKYDPVIHICSSSEVYGQVQKNEVPIKETNPLRPASPYAVSKAGEDLLAQQYFISWKLKTIRTRMFTHEGPKRGEVFAPSNFAKQIAAIEAGRQKPVVMVGNLNSVRTFMDVRDAVWAYWLLVNKCKPGEVYNIGGVETMTIGDMLHKLISFSKKKNITIKVDPKRLRPSDVTLQIPSVEKFARQTGWKPKISFDQTLHDMLDYWRNYYQIYE